MTKWETYQRQEGGLEGAVIWGMGPLTDPSLNLLVTKFLFFFLILFIYLAALSLSCSMWDPAP